MKVVILILRVEKSLKDKLFKRAKKEHKTLSQLVRELLYKAVE